MRKDTLDKIQQCVNYFYSGGRDREVYIVRSVFAHLILIGEIKLNEHGHPYWVADGKLLGD